MMKVEDMEQQERNSLDGGWTWSKLKTWKDLEDSLQHVELLFLQEFDLLSYIYFFP